MIRESILSSLSFERVLYHFYVFNVFSLLVFDGLMLSFNLLEKIFLIGVEFILLVKNLIKQQSSVLGVLGSFHSI